MLTSLVAVSLVATACSTATVDVTNQFGIAAAGDPVRLTNVAAEVGLIFTHGAFQEGPAADPVAMMGGGLCWLDFDRDGWLDLYALNSFTDTEAGALGTAEMLPRSALYLNRGGTFEDVSEGSGVDLPMRGNGCVAADLDNDGWPDLYVTTDRGNLLFWNERDGTFTEGATAAQSDAYGWFTGAAAGDVNGDGWIDLFVAGYVDLQHRVESPTQGFPNTHFGERDLLLLNQGVVGGLRPEFAEVGEAAGLEAIDFEYGLGAVLADLDDDGDLDLFVANDTNPNRLYENVTVDGDPTGLGFRFVERAEAAGVADANSGMGVAIGDFDANGRPDLFVTNFGQQTHSVFTNETDDAGLTFADATSGFGIEGLGVGVTGWGTSWADFDLDGDLDLIVANGNVPILDFEADAEPMQLFASRLSQGSTGFWDVSSEVGLGALGPLHGRGVAVADYDNDGDVDIAVSSIGGDLVLLRNDGASGNWLTVSFEPAIPGTMATVALPDGNERRCETRAGSSYLSTEDPRCHFGLGSVGEITEVRIRWPDGEERSLLAVAANQAVVVSRSG